MELEHLGKSFEHSNRKKKWAAVLGALGFTCYSAYRFYNSPSVVKKRQKLLKLFTALVSTAEMVSDSAEAIGILLKDMKEFIQSDSNQIPQNLKQVSKIAMSDEFSESLIRIARAMTLGIIRGYQHESIKSCKSSNFQDKVLDKLFSEAGSGFASVVIGSFARNLVMTLYSEWKSNDDFQNYSKWIDIAYEDKCRELLGNCIRLFVSTAVTVYLDKTMNVNTYDEIFAGLTNPKHDAKVKDMLVSVCNGAVETFIRTVNAKSNSNYSKINGFEDGLISGDEKGGIRTRLSRLKDKNQENGWARKMSSTLAVPTNRKFVLDVTGIVTFETVRSFLEFLLQKVSECMKKSDDVQQEVVDRGFEAIRCLSGKSSAVTTICLTLCLNILNSPWMLVPC